jgi:hypothetical protein
MLKWRVEPARKNKIFEEEKKKIIIQDVGHDRERC